MLEQFNSDVSRGQWALPKLSHFEQTFNLVRSNSNSHLIRQSFVSAIRISRTVRILSGSWFLGSRKLQSGFGLARVIDGMQQIKGEEEPRNNL